MGVPSPSELTGLGLNRCLGGHWLRPGPMEVFDLAVLWWRILAESCSFRGHWPVSSPIEVDISGLLTQRLLALTLSDRSHSLRPPLVGVPFLFCFIFFSFFFETAFSVDFWKCVSMFSSGCPGAHYVDQTDLQFTEIKLPFPPENWD